MFRIQTQDRLARATLISAFAFLYLYFYQGGGWNQNAHLDTIWSLAEEGTFEITAIANNTNDTASYDGHVYSNKPMGLPILLAPVYWTVLKIEDVAGAPRESSTVAKVNVRLLTFVGSGLPGIAVILMLYSWFRRSSARPWEAMTLATMFGAGSLFLPYSGVMMSHLLTAAFMFGSWFLLTQEAAGTAAILTAGALAGMATLTDYIVLPGVLLFCWYCLVKHGKKACLAFFAPLFVALAAIGWYNNVHFGGILRTSYGAQNALFKSENSWLGVLQFPQPIRLWWITLHPYRGLLYACPVFFLPIFSCLKNGKEKFASAKASALVVVGTVLYFIAFYLCFNGWTGGWSFGPRYLIPVLPLIFAYSLDALRYFRLPSLLLGAVSIVNMVAVSAVGIMIPSANTGVAANFDPVFEAFRVLQRNGVAIYGHGYNLGQAVGLAGIASLLPMAAALSLPIACVFALLKMERTAAQEQAVIHGEAEAR